MPVLSFTSSVKNLFARSDQFKRLCDAVDLELDRQSENSVEEPTSQQTREAINISGIVGGAGAFLLSLLYERHDGNILFITRDFDEAQNLADDMVNLVGKESVLFYPPHRVMPYDFHSPTGETTGQRLSALGGIISGQKKIVVAPVRSLIEPTMSKDTFISSSLRLSVGQELDPTDLVKQLVMIGFNRVTNVEEVGDFAVRGGLIDFFSPSGEHPIRVEFFGDEIESLRYFGVRDQRTINRMDDIELIPRREVPIRPETLENYLEKLNEHDGDLIRARFTCEPDLPGLEWMAVSFGIKPGSLVDYLHQKDIIVFDGGESLLGDMRDQFDEGKRSYQVASERFVEPPRIEDYFFNPDQQFEKLRRHTNIFVHPFRSQKSGRIDFAGQEHPQIGNRVDYLAKIINEYEAKNYLTVITCDNKSQAERLGEILSERGIDIPVEVFHIHSGFISNDLKIALLTDHQIFSRRFRRIKRRRYREGVALTSWSNLNRGDVVVHADYGLARFSKLESITVDGRTRDCLLLIYKDGDKLFVPIEEFNRVSKYAGKDATPKLTALGGPSWEKLKKRTKKAIAEMAADLIKLYAERKSRPGFQFGPDSTWQRQLEASFIYEETPDQLKAINAVKKDMESSMPGDRLICGDVGYGKTEVAVRAAFKAVENGKQVAILVPTTILAQQHFTTFASRLKDFPMKIEMLSRFRTRKEQKLILEELAAGRVDIVIGTHRLFSKDVVFRDLGLLVVDEEQRFGVAHKEKLRQLKKNVDTITLTATPIPRTLHMSLMGARDMSLIATSPRDRLPIHSEIVEFSPEIISEGILREIDRDGQIFFVHNRVQSINAMYRYLKKLLPQVEIGIAHGQMHEKELEGVMLAFLARRYQVLLCTAIIESGLDIPSVNTILINRADRFGLAQLYQLRGRVGRSPVRAYAYLMTPPYRLLSDDARKRLRAIEAHSDLGSGFALAMRDLEIRGAGNILGAKQSGFIEEIGFDLYTRLLEEAVAELKGEKVERLPDTKLEGTLNLFLPEDYVNENQLKVDIYRRLSDCQRLDDIEAIRDEVIDRFGRMPIEATQLFDGAGLRLTAAITGAKKVKVSPLRITIEYPACIQFARPDIEAIRRAIEAPIEFSITAGMKFTVDLSAIDSKDRLAYMRKSLDKIGIGLGTSAVGV